MAKKPEITRIAEALTRPTISVTEAGIILGVGKNAAYDAARSGDLPTIKIGHRILVPVAKLAKLLGLQNHIVDGACDGEI
ncbi:helix-turn-helix domain-containing protein [Pseudochrobactrum sp. B5]|uniref:helix-turn-helix domain-containing protein n=1 Tax=Pseudochrobactrum sp. B5 TaxID=1289478 RepID=UPI00095188E2|nr:helix-turn-helix domain-containing protein [Pseudochrobactrum sp. B5]